MLYDYFTNVKYLWYQCDIRLLIKFQTRTSAFTYISKAVSTNKRRRKTVGVGAPISSQYLLELSEGICATVKPWVGYSVTGDEFA